MFGALAAGLLAGGGLLPAQELINASGPGGVRLFNSDAAILEAEDTRKDLPCTVNPVKPQLGFDLKFHSGYEVSVPLKELAGAENQLTMVFKVTAEGRKDEPAYFSQRVNVPAIEENAGGPAYLSGTFDVGEGKFHVSCLMRDRRQHVAVAKVDVPVVGPADDEAGWFRHGACLTGLDERNHSQ